MDKSVTICPHLKWRGHNNIIVSCPSFDSNILEGDIWVWAHAFSEVASRILILSADNDTYHIRLPVLHKHPDKSVFVALDTQLIQK